METVEPSKLIGTATLGRRIGTETHERRETVTPNNTGRANTFRRDLDDSLDWGGGLQQPAVHQDGHLNFPTILPRAGSDFFLVR